MTSINKRFKIQPESPKERKAN